MGGITLLCVILSILSVLCVVYFDARLGKQTPPFKYVSPSGICAVLTSVSSFMYFKDLKMRNSRFVNRVAASTFGVLLIHDNCLAMRQWLWHELMPVKSIYALDSINSIVTILIVILGIFVACILLDMLRKNMIEKPLFEKINIYNMKINIVIPCYNEQEVLNKTIEVLCNLSERIKLETGVETQLLLVDDGSKDKTWSMIREAAGAHSFVGGIKLSHNRGHQNALWAGMEASIDHCDAMVSIDADLQDDENVIVDMVRQLKEGKDIVYGVRKERNTDTFFKRFTAQAFYKIMQMADKEVIYNHADFRLMSNRALKALMQYPERNLFLRAIVRELGFNEGYVYYDRKAREAGESKYPLKKMLAFSIDGITSFSVAPLKFITFIGLAMTFVAMVIIVFALVEHFKGETIQGWTSILVSMWFIGGMITTGVGITGLYIGKIYTEVKRRPRYFIEERI